MTTSDHHNSSISKLLEDTRGDPVPKPPVYEYDENKQTYKCHLCRPDMPAVPATIEAILTHLDIHQKSESEMRQISNWVAISSRSYPCPWKGCGSEIPNNVERVKVHIAQFHFNQHILELDRWLKEHKKTAPSGLKAADSTVAVR